MTENARELMLDGEPRRAIRFLAALCVGLPAMLVLVSLGITAADSGLPPNALIAAATPIALTCLLFLWLRARIMHVAVRVVGHALEIDAGISRRRYPLATLARSPMRVIDLAEHPQVRPLLRTWGIGLPGMKLGWYRLRSGARALCVLGSDEHVSVLRAEDNVILLLSLAHPQALRQELEKISSTTTD